MDYRSKAVSCVKDTVMPEMRRQFEECGCDLDEQYKKYGDTEFFFANIIEPRHVYELGYPNFCECSRQSVLYILENLLPEKTITVETTGTVLNGADKCTFRVTVKE